MTLDTLNHILVVSILALGVSYVITGSTIGYGIRVFWWRIFRNWTWKQLAFCPSCNAWWAALVIAGLGGSHPLIMLQDAFAACGIAAMVQSAFGLAAADEDEIRDLWRSGHGEAGSGGSAGGAGA